VARNPRQGAEKGARRLNLVHGQTEQSGRAHGARPFRRVPLERLAGWLYRKAGARYFEALVALMVLAVLGFMVPGYTALLVPYFHASGRQYLQFVGVFEISLGGAGAIMYMIAMARHRPLLRWLHGERSSETAPAAWESAVTGVPVTTAIGLGWWVLCCIPPAIYVSTAAGLGWTGLVLYLIFLLLLYTGVAVFVYLFFEQALRPVVREIAAELPPQFVPRRRTLSSGTKALLLLPAINVFTGSVVAAVSTNSLGLEGRLAVTLAVTVVVSMTVSLVLMLMFRQSLLQRLHGLQEAIIRVDGGDFSARVPLLAGDEFDHLGYGFNAMVAGLHEREVLHGALGSYIDESVAAQMLSEGEALPGREVEVTVLFLDIRDFTSLADRSTPPEVVRYLTEFFGLVVPIVRKHRGHANKLLGDGLLAVFGAPLELERHADHAVQAAGEIVEHVHRRYDGDLRLGIGLHTGEVVAGTIGGGGKLDYTLIGDAVNVAARVQELTKLTGDTLLLTEATRRQLSEQPTPLRPRGPRQLRGKAYETPIYAIEPARAST
jgi:adenylate cyclase